MRSDDILSAIDGVGSKWTRQIKAEERRPSSRRHRETMWYPRRVPLTEICAGLMEEAWNKASDNGRLPTHWRQIFYVMRPLVDEHPQSDRPLLDTTFKAILEDYLQTYTPGWDVLKGARGVFKEPHRARDDHGLAMSTMNVRQYLRQPRPTANVESIATRFPTNGYRNRFGAVLVCEKEGFDELLSAEMIPDKYDLALMSTKGISAIAARDLVAAMDIQAFTLHDFDKNGFVMAAGFDDAIDIGIRMGDIEEWDLTPEDQVHRNPAKAYNNLIRNGATAEEAAFISDGQRVELNMLTGPQFIEFVEGKLQANGVEKVVPDEEVLVAAWKRVQLLTTLNKQVEEANKTAETLEPPDDLVQLIRDELEENPELSWDDALAEMVEE